VAWSVDCTASHPRLGLLMMPMMMMPMMVMPMMAMPIVRWKVKHRKHLFLLPVNMPSTLRLQLLASLSMRRMMRQIVSPSPGNMPRGHLRQDQKLLMPSMHRCQATSRKSHAHGSTSTECPHQHSHFKLPLNRGNSPTPTRTPPL